MHELIGHKTSNVALNKPALQSSISNWSIGQTVESDASIATNGDILSNAVFHTDYENGPWWQVDLQDDFAIEEIRILNRREVPERLKFFTILVSLTMESDSWLQIYHKNTELIPGNDSHFVIIPDFRCIARFVRVRLDGAGFLHFRECEVLGYRPDNEEHARLRQETLLRQRDVGDVQARLERELMDGRRGHVTRMMYHSIFVDTDKYSPTMVSALDNGLYEERERKIVRTTVRPGDRVLEIGTAIGVVTMAIASIVGAPNVVTYDANPAIVTDARRNFAANGLGEISANVGVMRNRNRWSDLETEVDFFVAQDFWASRLHASAGTSGIVEVVKVPLICLENKIAEHCANVLVCDIEGGEADLLTDADLAPVRMIIMETHYWACGRGNIDSMIRYLLASGFNICLDHTGGHVVVLDKEL